VRSATRVARTGVNGRCAAAHPSCDPQQAQNENKSGRGPKRDGSLGDSRLEQHELAVARDQVFAHLRVAVARLEPLAHQNAQVAGERRVGIVDRLILT